MSKRESVNQSAVPETGVESQSSATSIEHHFLTLNVNSKTEKKQNLTYLSWAWAWSETLRHDPKASFRVHTFSTAQDGAVPYMEMKDGTCMVWVDVTIQGTTRTCFLPVMDYRNKPITEPDAFAINTALMRCLTKCLGLFGLGLYIYAGEDLPPDSDEKKPEVKVEVPAEEKTPQNADTQAEMDLFAEGVIKLVDMMDDEKALRSYWKSNQTQLDKLKANSPELYDKVLARFKQAQSAFKALEQVKV